LNGDLVTSAPRSTDPAARASNWQARYGSAIGIAGQAEHVGFDEARRFLTALATGVYPRRRPG